MHINDWSNPHNFGPIVKDTVIHVVNKELFSQRISPIVELLDSVMLELSRMNSTLVELYRKRLEKDRGESETRVVSKYVQFVVKLEDEIKNAQLGGKLRNWDESHDGRIKKFKEAFKKIESFEFSMFSRSISSDILDEVKQCLRAIDSGYKQDLKYIEQAASHLKDDMLRNASLSENVIQDADISTPSTQEIESLLNEVSYFNNALVPYRALNDYHTLIEITDYASISVSHDAFEIITSWELKNMKGSVTQRFAEIRQKYQDLMTRPIPT